MHGGTVAAYFDTAAMVTVLVLLGQMLEIRARGATSQAIKNLLDLAPKQARVIEPDGRELDVAVEMVRVAQRLRVRPGERIPVDGTVEEGQSAVDEAMISGEPMQLIETLAQRLVEVCLADARVDAATVTVHKPHAPIPHQFADVAVTIRRGRSEPDQ